MTRVPTLPSGASPATERIAHADLLPVHPREFCMVHSIRSTSHQVARRFLSSFEPRHFHHRATRFVPTTQSALHRELVIRNCLHSPARFQSETVFPGCWMPRTPDCFA